MTNQDFSDIAPYCHDEDFRAHMAHLVEEPQFAHAVKWVMPHVDYDAFARKLLSINTCEAFQVEVMQDFLTQLEAATTAGITAGGMDNVAADKNYVFISNHRDIVLDASFLNLMLLRNGLRTCEIAIGNNLLIMPWIDELVRINKSFIVKRDTGMRGALEAAKHLSAYIHHTIADTKESLWIAHREGRAKDSNDRTQEGLVKMLALAGEGNTLYNIKEINLLPVSISYEYDPNDYLKAREFLLRRRNPDFKKSPHDDLLSMETGIMQQKGRIHFEMTECINPELDVLPQDLHRSQACAKVCEIVDAHIHRAYRLYPINYVAYDLLEGSHRFADQYTPADVDAVNQRIATQLAKITDVDNITSDEMNYMRQMVLTMYSNPLRNKICESH